MHPVYTGENATEDFERLRDLIFGIVPVPGLFFCVTRQRIKRIKSI